jgi:phosphohistidine phosphatase
MFATSAIANVELSEDGSIGKFEWQVGPSQVMAKV